MPPNSVQSSPDVGQRFLLMKIKHTDHRVPGTTGRADSKEVDHYLRKALTQGSEPTLAPIIRVFT
jgi:hypothetical protein